MGNNEELIKKVEEFEREQNTPGETEKKKKSKKKYILNISLVLIITAFSIFFTVKDDFGLIVTNLLNCDWRWLLVTFGMMIAAVLIRSLVLFCFARLYTRDYHYHQAIAVDHIGTFYNAVTPGASGGQVMQAYTYKKQGIQISSAVSMLAMYSIVFQIVLILYGLVSFIVKYKVIGAIGFIEGNIGDWSFQIPIWPLTIFGFMLNVGVILIVLLMGYWKGFHNFIMGPCISLGTKLHLIKNPDKSRENLRIQVENFKVEFRRMFSNIPFTILVFFLFFCYMTIRYSIPYFVGQVLHNESTCANFWDAIFLGNYHQMVTGLIPVPGGAGVSEYFFNQLFVSTNATPSTSFFYKTPDWSLVLSTAQEIYNTGTKTWAEALEEARAAAARTSSSALGKTALLIWRSITFIFPIMIAGFVTAFYRASPKKEAELNVPSRDTFVSLQNETFVQRSQELETLLETNRLSREAIMKKLRASSNKPKRAKKEKKVEKKQEYRVERKEHLNNRGKVKTVPLIITGVTLAAIIASYFLLGLNMTLIIFGGLLIAFLIGRAIDKAKTKKKKHKVLKIVFIIILIIAIICLIAGGLFIGYIVKNAPTFDPKLLDTKEATVLYDSDGNEFAKIGAQIREKITYDEMSESLVDAIVATEDSRFFQHNGFDLMRFIKASIGQIAGQSDAGGASTLTMQVSKNTFTSTESHGIEGIIRKFTDIYISIFQIEKNYTKEEIIEFYANNQLLGGVWGVQEASKYYFGKDCKDLNLAEASLIAGIFKSPIYYNPYNYPENATSRRATVLYLMERHGYITHEERVMANSIPVTSLLDPDNDTSGSEFQGYIDTVVEEIKDKVGVNAYQTPLLIYTNMKVNKQRHVNEIMNNDGYSFWHNDPLRQGATVVIDSSCGKIEAIGTGRHRSGKNSYNYATQTKRQQGSTAKPLYVYGPAIEYNGLSPANVVDDSPYTYSNGKKITNYDGAYLGVITIRYALSDSRNIPSLKTFQSVNNKKIVEAVTKMGLTPEVSNGYIHEAHAVGAYTGTSPLQLAGAYQVMSNGGSYYEPYSVNKLIFRETDEEYTFQSEKVDVFSSSTTYIIADILKSVSAYWLHMGLPNDSIAAKTGTTNISDDSMKKYGIRGTFFRDSWVIGFTPETTISIWLGYDEISQDHKLQDDAYNERLWFWNTVAKGCLNHTGRDFVRPEDVISVTVEKGTPGQPLKLPSEGTPDSEKITDLFRKGTEPTEVSRKFMAVGSPKSLNYEDEGSKLKLTWNAVGDPGYVNGTFGYYVYKDGTQLEFTTKLSYTYVGTNLEGTYTVRAGYKDTDECLSAPATITYSMYSLTVPDSVHINVGDSVPNKVLTGTNFVVFKVKKSNRTPDNISVSITDSNGATVSSIDTSKAGQYKIKYDVSYETYKGSATTTLYVDGNDDPDDQTE